MDVCLLYVLRDVTGLIPCPEESYLVKALFIIPTDAHNYKITGILKQLKIPTVTPT
jgi:hypothetical protein